MEKHLASIKRLVSLLIAVFITALTVASLWVLVVKPANQALFEAEIHKNTQNYQQQIQQYLTGLQQPLTSIARSIPSDIFQQDVLQQKQWVDDHKNNWEAQLPNMTNIELFSINTLQNQDTAISFIVINMANRLKVGRATHIEVARTADKKHWQLHKIVPIQTQDKSLLGILHAIYPLTGIQNIFSQSDPNLEKIILRQYLNNEPPLQFFTQGQGSAKHRQKVLNIQDSYWQMSYQPTERLLTHVSSTPLWLWILGAILPIALYGISARLIHPTEQVQPSKKKTTTHKEKTVGTIPAIDKEIMETTQEVELEQKANVSANIADHSNNEFPDCIFRAYDIRGLVKTQLTHELTYAIGQAVASMVLDAGDDTLIVGYDARTHSPELSRCIIEGIIGTGCHVINIGLVPTPLMNFSACTHPSTSSGIIITASHNPKEYNGCKIVIKGNTLVDEDIQALKTRIIEKDVTTGSSNGTVEQGNLSQAYIDRIVSDVAVIDGWKVAIDAGNGAASELAPRLFNAMQCDVTPLFCQFDGEFPNHDPDPSIAENLEALINTVKSSHADIGFAFDGDGDRLMVVTPQGRIVWPDQLLMIFAQDVVTRYPGSDVVFDIKSTYLLNQVIREHGGRPVMWKTGHSHIKSKMKETQALLGGEYSGHIFFKERWFGFDDGLYAAARLLEILTLSGQTIDNLLNDLPMTISTPEIKIPVPEEQKFALVDLLRNDAHFNAGNMTTIDGLRVDYNDGWGLVRASNTAPVLTLRFEAKDEETLNQIKHIFDQALHSVDLSLPN